MPNNDQPEILIGMLPPSLVTCSSTPAALAAQSNPVSNAVRATPRDNGKNLLAAAQAMPADKYGYKPTPAQMTFGELIFTSSATTACLRSHRWRRPRRRGGPEADRQEG